MILKKPSLIRHNEAVSAQQHLFTNREFQLRYIVTLTLSSISGVVIAMLPVYWLLSSNFAIFKQLAYETSPHLLDYLEREYLLVQISLIAVFLALTSFFFIMGWRLSQQIVGPIEVLRKHLRRMARGHWHGNQIQVRDDDEFRDLIDTYNYFLSAFNKHQQQELALIEQLQVAPHDSKSQALKTQLIQTKREQLQINSTALYDHPTPYHTEGQDGISDYTNSVAS